MKLLAFRQLLFVPAADRIVVVGSRIGDAVRFRVEGPNAVSPVFEVELEDLHPWKVQGVLQGTDVVGDDA